MLRAQAPTLVLAECVLVYLDAAEAAGVVAALGSLLPNAIFAVYEQVMYMSLLTAPQCMLSVAWACASTFARVHT